jgi:DNA-binding protein Fis
LEAARFERLVRDELALLLAGVLPDQKGQLYRQILSLVEFPLLTQILKLTGGNQLRAARLLGINRNTLRKRLQRLGIVSQPERRRKSAVPSS